MVKAYISFSAVKTYCIIVPSNIYGKLANFRIPILYLTFNLVSTTKRTDQITILVLYLYHYHRTFVTIGFTIFKVTISLSIKVRIYNCIVYLCRFPSFDIKSILIQSPYFTRSLSCRRSFYVYAVQSCLCYEILRNIYKCTPMLKCAIQNICL